MPISQEALDIFEEESKKPQITNPLTELFFRAPPKKKEKIPEWTAKGEIVWPTGPVERKLTDKEEEELSLMKEIKLLRQTANLGDRMEAFTQGLLPVGDKDILEKAFPLSSLGGTMTRYILQSQMIASKLPGITSGIHGYLSQPMKPLAQLMRITPQFLADPITSILWSESFPRMAAFATQRALTWGSAKLGENILRGVTGDELSTKKIIWEPTTTAGLGALMGGVHGISGLWTSSLVSAGIGGGKEAIEKYLKNGNLGKEDIGDILLQAGFYGMVEAIGHEQVQKMWQSKEMQDFEYNRWYSRLLGQGQSPEEAKLGANIAVSNMGPAGSSLRRAMYERVFKPNLPGQITNLKGKAAEQFTNNLINRAQTPQRSLADALSKTVGDHIKNSTQNLLEASLLEQIDIHKQFIKSWERVKTSMISKPEHIQKAEQAIAERQKDYKISKDIIKEADAAIAWRQKDIESIQQSLDELQKRKKPLELPVFEEYLKLPASKSKEGLSSYEQMRYGKALENVLKDKLKYTDEDIQELKQGKSFSYQKENAMTEQESARVIMGYEDVIEQASLHEEPQWRETLKEMDKMRTKWLGAREKEVFDDVLRMKLPEELKKDIDKDWTLLDYIRPFWRVARKDPMLFENHEYVVNQYGTWKRAANAEKLRARKKAKELGLTGEDRRIVTAKKHTDFMISHGQKDLKPIPLNEKQAKMDDWLTKNFEGLHSFFGLERKIPFHMYLPYITETDNIGKGFLSELYPEYLPKNITAFFEKRRQSEKLDNYREDCIDLYEMYIDAGMKKKYMLPAIRRARRDIIQNPNIAANLKSHYQDWFTWMLGYPSLADSSFTNLFQSWDASHENAYRVSRMMINLTYMGGIGVRPMSAVRNLFQNLNTASELGYTWTTSGFRDFMFNGGTNHAREKGVLLEYLPELYSEMGKYSNMQKLRDATLFMYRKADETNRSIAYYGAENKFNYFYKQYGNTNKFFEKSGINFVDKVKRTQIKDLVNQNKIDEARHEFGKEIVAKTQYLYSKENSPLIQRSIGGKLLFQFKSWPENYGELLADWGRNKNYMAFVRALGAYAVLGYMGNKMGQKWLTRTIPIGTLPIDQWRLERALVPATIGPIADLLFLFASPLEVGLTTQDPEKIQKAFENRLKALGKDTLLYIPGGLAMKDFFKIAPTIPGFSLGQPGQTGTQPGQLKFKSLKESKSKLKFKNIL